MIDVAVVVDAVVPGREDVQDGFHSSRAGHRIPHQTACKGSADQWPTQSAIAVVGDHDIDAAQLQVMDVIETLDGVGIVARAGSGKEFARPDFHVPVDAAHAQTIVAAGADGPGDVSAVPVVIHRVTRSGYGINAADIIDVTIPLIVDAITGDLEGIGPHIGSQVGVRVVNAAVDHEYDHVRRSGSDVPRLGSIDVSV